MRRARERDEGFTLIELMTVVLIIAILLAIAIPTFLGARTAAAERAAQSNARNAHTNAMIYYADHQQFTAAESILEEQDASLSYINDINLLEPGPVVYIEVQSSHLSKPNDTVILGTKTATGRCFWMRTIGDENHPRFAANTCGGVPAATDFADNWD